MCIGSMEKNSTLTSNIFVYKHNNNSSLAYLEETQTSGFTLKFHFSFFKKYLTQKDSVTDKNLGIPFAYIVIKETCHDLKARSVKCMDSPKR